MNKWQIVRLASALLVATFGASAATATSQKKNTWSDAYGGANKSFDTHLLAMRAEIAPRFQTFNFKDTETGRTMQYNLFVPKNYDPRKSYPLVLFMADASTTGKGAAAPLMQGYGGIIWASKAEQSKHPSFVLVPAFE
jgi:predicted peptidase